MQRPEVLRDFSRSSSSASSFGSVVEENEGADDYMGMVSQGGAWRTGPFPCLPASVWRGARCTEQVPAGHGALREDRSHGACPLGGGFLSAGPGGLGGWGGASTLSWEGALSLPGGAHFKSSSAGECLPHLPPSLPLLCVPQESQASGTPHKRDSFIYSTWLDDSLSTASRGSSPGTRPGPHPSRPQPPPAPAPATCPLPLSSALPL